MSQLNQFDGYSAKPRTPPAACAICEAMLPDAVDGMLSETEQRAFDRHVAGCVECARELAEAQRGAAWLAILKSEAPEAPAGMLDRILAETTRWATTAAPADPAASRPPTPPLPSAAEDRAWVSANPASSTRVGLNPATPGRGRESSSAPGGGLWPVASRAAAAAGRWLPLWPKPAGMFRIDSAQPGLQPRLAMTAAMAFFSIALTLNLTGIRLREVRAERFTPSGLRRTAVDASAAAIRSFQNVRVVYQVESRVDELGSGGEDDPDRDKGSGDSVSGDRAPLIGTR